ncbi:MAG: FKBP-type peptidyl-prolyl cis-trans isomerase [Myxococcales bacterium]|nr:FKBP-type peptidyl-prolyl cis-trans isomerase [Myxococcales bacterium]
MKVEPGKRVRIEYELKVQGGAVLESSESSGPIEYIHGGGKMLPSLEARMEGMEVDDERDGVIPPEEIYVDGVGLPTRVIPRAEFPDDPEVGKKFQAKEASGDEVTFEVIGVDDENVTVRLEGKGLEYKVKVLAVHDQRPPPPLPTSEGGSDDLVEDE